MSITTAERLRLIQDLNQYELDLVVCAVKPTGRHEWTVQFDPLGGTWLTVHRDQIGREPEVGDILTIIQPIPFRIRRPVMLKGGN